MTWPCRLWNRFCALRFVIVGGWNTVFSYLVFSGLYWLMGGGWGDVLVQMLLSVIGITQAYVIHKFVTYRSKGVWWKEYIRFYVVYGIQSVFQAALFVVFVTWIGCNAYITQFVLVASFTIASYWAHKNFSFRKGKQ